MIYAGIGSRATPPAILQSMEITAQQLASEGWLLRSGGADGADRAFEYGCNLARGAKEIWLPWKGFNGSKSDLWLPEFGAMLDRAMTMAEFVHPAWHRCSQAARRLHARNVLQIFGGDFRTPADKVICWTLNGETIGGTATAIRLAQREGIEVVNLGAP